MPVDTRQSTRELSRHIVDRPRLVRLAENSTSRIVLLNAPAGYGKTTFAHQWTDDAFEHVGWFRCRPASTDLAAMATGLASALDPHVVGLGAEVARLVQTPTIPPLQAAQEASAIVARLIQGLPETCLGIDDYQLILGAAAPELLVQLLAQTDLFLVIASRARPSWVTARQVLYGDVLELGRTALAMSQEEADRVLEGEQAAAVPGLVSVAEGWPAVIGLAATASRLALPDEVVADALYDF